MRSLEHVSLVEPSISLSGEESERGGRINGTKRGGVAGDLSQNIATPVACIACIFLTWTTRSVSVQRRSVIR